MVPLIRISALNAHGVNSNGRFVLYWMTTYRRPFHNFALERALEWCSRLEKPLVILEVLRVDYPWASDRLHAMILQGMEQNRDFFAEYPVRYHPYVESNRGEGRGLVAAIARDAAVIVSDDFPTFIIPRMLKTVARRVPCLFEGVDSNGIFPMREPGRTFVTAYSFRRYVQKKWMVEAPVFPKANSLAEVHLPEPPPLPQLVLDRWPAADEGLLKAFPESLAAFPIDHSVQQVRARGGWKSASERLESFLHRDLSRYAQDRSHPDDDATSGLSPYLHFGYISAQQIFLDISDREGWSPISLYKKPDGRRAGWWGMSEGAEAFLDQLLIWRELGFNMCAETPDHDRFESLPAWARNELEARASDPRRYVYGLDEFENAATHDRLWNAAQMQLREEGIIHNTLRMLWGKKILEWTASPREALKVMIDLNNKYAVDGRDPNSISGIFWILGRYDRPWGPVRPIFGKIRYMSSTNTARKVRLAEYLDRFGRS